MEVSFWDGETFGYKNSLPTDRAAWWRLSEDGGRCVFTDGRVKSLAFVVRYLAPRGPIRVWDVGAGKIEQTLPALDGLGVGNIHTIHTSPDEKFLVIRTEPRKGKGMRLAVWELVRGDAGRREFRPRYEVAPSSKIRSEGVAFSPDGKYLAFVAGLRLQIHEARTGEKRFDLPGTVPDHWLGDAPLILSNYGPTLVAHEAVTGRRLYEHPMPYRWHTQSPAYVSENTFGDQGEVVVTDRTLTAPHPGGEIFVAWSREYVRVFEARTARILQVLVSRPGEGPPELPQPVTGLPVSEVNWSGDGKTLYAIGHHGKTVTLWGRACAWPGC